MLSFSNANAKLEALYDVPELGRWLMNGRHVYSLDLLSGWSCPFASDCLSKVHETGEISLSGNPRVKLMDGPNTQYRCFSASQEALLPNVYAKRKHNYDTLKGLKSFTAMTERLCEDLPKKCGILRFHVGGDFFNADYFLAAIHTAKANPDRLFYAYTKSLKYWKEFSDHLDQIDNFVLTASRGGRDDDMIDRDNLREAVVVFSEEEAHNRGLEIDHDDSHAAVPEWRNNSFALLVHGIQPKGSKSAEALRILKRDKAKHSYGKGVMVAV